MKIAIALTLAFFATVSVLGAWRDIGRLRRDLRPARLFGVAAASAMALWCVYASAWLLLL